MHVVHVKHMQACIMSVCSLSLSLLYIQIKNIFKKVCDGIGEMVLEVKVFDNLTGFQGPMQRQEKYVQIVL